MSDLSQLATSMDDTKLRAANRIWQEYGRVDRTIMYEKIDSMEHMLSVLFVMVEELKKVVEQIKEL